MEDKGYHHGRTSWRGYLASTGRRDLDVRDDPAGIMAGEYAAGNGMQEQAEAAKWRRLVNEKLPGPEVGQLLRDHLPAGLSAQQYAAGYQAVYAEFQRAIGAVEYGRLTVQRLIDVFNETIS